MRLQNYDHVPQVRAARKAMCKQLAGLMMSQWDQHRHICENYNPHKTARIAHTPFYSAKNVAHGSFCTCLRGP